nr:MAG TPA: hypothetical protein [Caudoviricetes sp.]DAU45434.1 MAG TPA: hypothetical protein [Caudoviricetes sp.]DAZ25855.1 MAG TPA: hypothetical protein [Caudoviricetes sp.]
MTAILKLLCRYLCTASYGLFIPLTADSNSLS